MFRQALSFPVSGREGGKSFVFGGLAVIGLLAGGAVALGAVGTIADAVVQGDSVEAVYYGLGAGGGVVGLFCYLLLAGFTRRVLAAAATGQTTVPAFGTVGSLLGDGGRVLAVKAGYLTPGLVLFVASVFLAEAPLTGLSRTVGRALAALSLLLFLLYLVILFYVVPAAVARFAVEGEVRAAFDLRALASVVVSEDYAVGWVVGTLLVGVGNAVAILLMVFVVGFFAFFHVNTAARYCYGNAVGRVLDHAARQRRESVSDDGPATSDRSTSGEQRATDALPSDADPMAREIRRRQRGERDERQ